MNTLTIDNKHRLKRGHNLNGEMSTKLQRRFLFFFWDTHRVLHSDHPHDNNDDTQELMESFKQGQACVDHYYATGSYYPWLDAPGTGGERWYRWKQWYIMKTYGKWYLQPELLGSAIFLTSAWSAILIWASMT